MFFLLFYSRHDFYRHYAWFVISAEEKGMLLTSPKLRNQGNHLQHWELVILYRKSTHSVANRYILQTVLSWRIQLRNFLSKFKYLMGTSLMLLHSRLKLKWPWSVKSSWEPFVHELVWILISFSKENHATALGSLLSPSSWWGKVFPYFKFHERMSTLSKEQQNFEAIVSVKDYLQSKCLSESITSNALTLRTYQNFGQGK